MGATMELVGIKVACRANIFISFFFSSNVIISTTFFFGFDFTPPHNLIKIRKKIRSIVDIEVAAAGCGCLNGGGGEL